MTGIILASEQKGVKHRLYVDAARLIRYRG
uniref:Uncharacterized protein n=1 Tax=virus sp. ctPLL24 TaxID=2826802 RepID=A0A8S5R0J1_9VIRU|nr:MAG TPA: hypothetical protein [virus sp. ctPLL24]DAO04841.1 MAG TPA: hypothetical protein [Caudoviricetes sp.]